MSALNRKVLVVDDDITVCKLLTLTLKRGAIAALSTTSPKEALEIALSQPLDVIISDVKMPEISGLELLKILRDKNIMTPFIIISAQSNRDTLLSALYLGAFDLIAKPFQASIINQLLDEAIRAGNRQTQLAKIRTNISATYKDLETAIHWTLANVAPVSTFDAGTLDQKTLELIDGREGPGLLLATGVHALTSTRSMIENLKNFQSRTWDLGVLVRVFHGLRAGFATFLDPQFKEMARLLGSLENCYAWLRIRPEDLSSDVVISLGMASDQLVIAFKTFKDFDMGQPNPSSEDANAMEKLSQIVGSLDMRFQKIYLRAAS
jgi:DNA-binding response OmpR family regulator